MAALAVALREQDETKGDGVVVDEALCDRVAVQCAELGNMWAALLAVARREARRGFDADAASRCSSAHESEHGGSDDEGSITDDDPETAVASLPHESLVAVAAWQCALPGCMGCLARCSAHGALLQPTSAMRNGAAAAGPLEPSQLACPVPLCTTVAQRLCRCTTEPGFSGLAVPSAMDTAVGSDRSAAAEATALPAATAAAAAAAVGGPPSTTQLSSAPAAVSQGSWILLTLSRPAVRRLVRARTTWTKKRDRRQRAREERQERARERLQRAEQRQRARTSGEPSAAPAAPASRATEPQRSAAGVHNAPAAAATAVTRDAAAGSTALAALKTENACSELFVVRCVCGWSSGVLNGQRMLLRVPMFPEVTLTQATELKSALHAARCAVAAAALSEPEANLRWQGSLLRLAMSDEDWTALGLLVARVATHPMSSARAVATATAVPSLPQGTSSSSAAAEGDRNTPVPAAPATERGANAAAPVTQERQLLPASAAAAFGALVAEAGLPGANGRQVLSAVGVGGLQLSAVEAASARAALLGSAPTQRAAALLEWTLESMLVQHHTLACVVEADSDSRDAESELRLGWRFGRSADAPRAVPRGRRRWPTRVPVVLLAAAARGSLVGSAYKNAERLLGERARRLSRAQRERDAQLPDAATRRGAAEAEARLLRLLVDEPLWASPWAARLPMLHYLLR